MLMSIQVKITADGELLDVITGLAVDWKYDVLVASSSRNHDASKINHRISVIPSLKLMKKEQEATREETDYSEL